MPGVRPGVETWPLEGGPAPRRRRTGLWVGIGVGVVALFGAAAAGWFLVGAKLVAPASPTAAVDRLVDGLEHKDGLALLGALSPAEVQPFRQMAAEMTHDAAPATADPAATRALQDAFDSVTVTADGLQLQEQTLDDGLTKVSITGGTLTFDGDPEAIADALVEVMGQQNPLAAEDATTMHDGIVGSLSLPYTVDFADEDTWGDRPFYVVTVHEGRGWYVSPLMTLGDYMFMSAGTGVTRGAMPGDADVAHPASPQEAAQQLAAAVPSLVGGDSGALVSVLPEAERRFVAVYLEPLIARSTAEGEPPVVSLTASDFAVTDQTSDRAFVAPVDLAYRVEADGQAGTMSFDGDCLTTAVDDASGSYHGCISDVPLLTELGLDHPALVAVHEDGGWYVSVIGTYAELVRTAGENVVRLQQEGKLDDPEWLQQQLPSLVGLLGGNYDAGPADLGGTVGTDQSAEDAVRTQLTEEMQKLTYGCVDGDPASCEQLCGTGGLYMQYEEVFGEVPVDRDVVCSSAGGQGQQVPSTRGE